MAQAKISFGVTGWDEKTWAGQPSSQVSGAKRTHSVINYNYEGDLVGESTLHYLMSYNEDGTGSYVGIEHVTGSLAGRSGSFDVQHVGTFEPVRATLTILPGSATGDLKGLRGQAEAELVGHQERYPFTLDYDFE